MHFAEQAVQILTNVSGAARRNQHTSLMYILDSFTNLHLRQGWKTDVHPWTQWVWEDHPTECRDTQVQRDLGCSAKLLHLHQGLSWKTKWWTTPSDQDHWTGVKMGWSMENWWKLKIGLEDVDTMVLCKDSTDIYSITMTPIKRDFTPFFWRSGFQVSELIPVWSDQGLHTPSTQQLSWLQGTMAEPWRRCVKPGKSSNEVMQKDEMFATSTPTEVHDVVWQDINIQSVRDQWPVETMCAICMFLGPSLEALSFSASLRLSGPREDRKELISELLGSLGLRSCAHTCPQRKGMAVEGSLNYPFWGGRTKAHVWWFWEISLHFTLILIIALFLLVVLMLPVPYVQSQPVKLVMNTGPGTLATQSSTACPVVNEKGRPLEWWPEMTFGGGNLLCPCYLLKYWFT